LRHRFIQAADAPNVVRRTVGRLGLPALTLTPPSLLGYEPTPRKTAAFEKPKDEVEVAAMLHSVYDGTYSDLKRELLSNVREQGFNVEVLNNEAEYNVNRYEEADVIFMRFYADYPDADTFIHYLLHSRGGIYGNVCGMAELDQLIERG